jgi:hypothetical protein
MVDRILILHMMTPPFDHRPVHVAFVSERAVAELQDVFVSEVGI